MIWEIIRYPYYIDKERYVDEIYKNKYYLQKYNISMVLENSKP